jgi:adenine/guanine phosphoribosyltransferase-like PRPP-binding protein
MSKIILVYEDSHYLRISHRLNLYSGYWMNLFIKIYRVSGLAYFKTWFMFRDRIEAGTLLAAKLKKFKDDSFVVLAIPCGGIPVAYAVAKELGFPLDVVFTKKSVIHLIRNMQSV